MASENFFSGMFQPVVLNTLGAITVAAGYKAKFYAAGTDIPKTIYTNFDLTTPYPSPANIAYLDDTGKSLIYLGLGGYKLVLTDPNDVPVPGYTIDNIVGIGAFGTGFVNSFEDLKDVNTSIFPYTYIGGYFAPGDGGEGMFYNATSVTAADGGYIQDSDFDPTKKWFRIPDENGEVRAQSFGYIPGSGSILTTALISADAYAASINSALRINGVYDASGAQIGAITFSAPKVIFAEGAGIRGTSAVPAVIFSGIVEAGNTQIFNRMAVTLSPDQSSSPYWFGASPDNTAGDNDAPLTSWAIAGGGGFILPPGNWNITSAGTFLASVVTIGFQALGVLNGVDFPFGPGLWNNGTIRTGAVKFSSGPSDAYLASSAADAVGVFGDLDITSDLDVVGNIVGGKVASNTTVTAVTDVEAGGNVIIGGAYSELNRTTNLGYWTDYTATLTVSAGTLSAITKTTNYTLIGKTLMIQFRVICTPSNSGVDLAFTIPAGLTLVEDFTGSTNPLVTNGAASTAPGSPIQPNGYSISSTGNKIALLATTGFAARATTTYGTFIGKVA